MHSIKEDLEVSYPAGSPSSERICRGLSESVARQGGGVGMYARELLPDGVKVEIQITVYQF